MSKFQPVKYTDVDDLLFSLPKDEYEITMFLRKLIFDCLPGVKEKLSYNVPFYYLNKRICFIWPGSVPWGKTKPGVAIGFTKGYLLSNPENYLEREDRKEVFMKTFFNVGDINVDILRLLIFEAAEIDKTIK